jgi:hypothetical protein
VAAVIRIDLSDERWVRALQKAVATHAEPVLREVKRLGRVYEVHSRSSSDMVYIVVLQVLEDGRAMLSCSCPAGSHDQPCWHAAAVWLSWSKEAVQS